MQQILLQSNYDIFRICWAKIVNPDPIANHAFPITKSKRSDSDAALNPPERSHQASRDSLGWNSDPGYTPPSSLSKLQEPTDNARVLHSLDSPVNRPVKSGLQVRF